MTLALIKMAGSNLKTSLYWIQNFSSRYVQFYYGTCPIHHMHTHIVVLQMSLTHIMSNSVSKFYAKNLTPNSWVVSSQLCRAQNKRKEEKCSCQLKKVSSIMKIIWVRCMSCQYGRVVKAIDLKSIGVPPRRFEPCCWRTFNRSFFCFCLAPSQHPSPREIDTYSLCQLLRVLFNRMRVSELQQFFTCMVSIFRNMFYGCLAAMGALQ